MKLIISKLGRNTKDSTDTSIPYSNKSSNLYPLMITEINFLSNQPKSIYRKTIEAFWEKQDKTFEQQNEMMKILLSKLDQMGAMINNKSPSSNTNVFWSNYLLTPV